MLLCTVQLCIVVMCVRWMCFRSRFLNLRGKTLYTVGGESRWY